MILAASFQRCRFCKRLITVDANNPTGRCIPNCTEDAEQCSGPVYNGSMSPPERCALVAGHEGDCEA